MPNIGAGEVGYYDTALVASTTSSFTFTGRDCDKVEVTKDDGAAVIFTVDGTDPATTPRAGYKLPAGVACSRVVPVPTAGATLVRVWSTGTPVVDVAEATP